MKKKYKTSQLIMLWLLPIIVIGGFFYPYLGYVVMAMMVFLLVMSYFKNRYWCWNFCPRGAFLDLVVSPLSRNEKIPRLFFNKKFRLLVLIVVMAGLILRLVSAGGSIKAIGLIFVSMCLVTTIAALVLGLFFSKRAWCSFCPMGYLQEEMHRFGKSKKRPS
jgi:polyferredoxin